MATKRQSVRYIGKVMMAFFRSVLLILFVIVCQVPAWAQGNSPFSKKYTPSFLQGSVKKYIKDIEDKTGVHISYSDASVTLKNNVKLSVKETSIYDALHVILDGQNVEIRESGDKILIIPAEQGQQSEVNAGTTINGYVKDNVNKEVLIGAIVYVPELGLGTTTNNYGFYSLSLPAGSHKILCSYLGYATDTLLFTNGKARRDITLIPQGTLAEINVVHERQTSADHNYLNYADIKNRPAVLGENDVMRALQSVSGVQSGTDGTNTIMVRGGDPGQNLNLLDGVPLYYVDHFFGLTSIYNSEAVKCVDFHKGAFPSRYGGRLSSVIDVSTKDGDMQKWGGQFNMGLIKGSLNLEGPIIKDKASIMLSARRTWIDMLWRPVTNSLRINFYDINAKANYILDKNNRLYLSIYNGGDGLGYDDTATGTNASWGNTVTSLKWSTIVNPKLFVHTSLTDSRFRFHLKDNQQIIEAGSIANNGRFEGRSAVTELALRMQAHWYATANQHIEFGAHCSRAEFLPAEISSSSGNQNTTTYILPSDKFNSNELVFFAENQIQVNERWSVRPGIHFATWFSERFNYPSFQPRFHTSYKIAKHHTIYASYTKMAQFLHLISNTTFGLPTDFWIPSSRKIAPGKSSLVTAGYMGKAGNVLSYNIEGYYKDLRNTVAYAMGKNLFDNSLNWDDKIVQGKGWSYGAEASVKLTLGKFSWSAAYTLSKTMRQFAQLNDNKPFPYRYDRRHNIRTTLLFQPNERFDAAFSWTYMSGESITLPDQIYPDFDNNRLISASTSAPSSNFTYNYVAWNNYQLPAIHRLDFGLNFTKKIWKHAHRTWSCGMFNAYGRRNIMFVELVNSDGNGGNFTLKGTGLLSYIPFVSYKLQF